MNTQLRYLFSLSYLDLAYLTFSLIFLACNAHPITPIDTNLNSVDRINNQLPAKTKLDFLFIVDDSGSMCQEQERLAENFTLFSEFLFDELQGAADYRIAVVNTDLGNLDVPTQKGHKPGEFLYLPAMGAQSCQEIEAYIPNTSDCENLGTVSPIISSVQLDSIPDTELTPGVSRTEGLKAELERQFRCRATLGTKGGSVEKGLEAMRLSLSCRGPNKELFSACCVNPGTEDAYYNPACRPPTGQEPQFLRPDATLVVLIISDEDDCSTPSDAPLDTSRLICRENGRVDANGDGSPDIYSRYCPNPQECYLGECSDYTAMGPDACYAQRCTNTESICDQKRTSLTSVREFKDFLYSLKARPLDQLFVAPLVGFRTYTELGSPHRYTTVNSTSNECANSDSSTYGTEACCPNGVCPGLSSPIQSCNIPEQSVLAFSGTRYLELADQLGSNAIGCPTGQEPTFDPTTRTFTSNAECINLCGDDLSVPLTLIKDRVAKLVNTYCLDRSPPCIIQEGEGTRLCEGIEETHNPANYQISVSVVCDPDRCTPTQNSVVGPLSSDLWTLQINDAGCPVEVRLQNLPPAGSKIVIEFIATSDALLMNP